MVLLCHLVQIPAGMFFKDVTALLGKMPSSTPTYYFPATILEECDLSFLLDLN